jgi:hypothetical protein
MLPCAPTERRPTRRKKVLAPGTIVSLDGARTADCTIKDISADGARIDLRDASFSTGWFYFIHLAGRTAYRATVAWRSGNDAGLKFSDTYQLSAQLQPDLRFIKQLWLEKAAR